MTSRIFPPGERQSPQAPTVVLLLLTLALLIALYAVARFGGQWGEIDTHNATVFIRGMYETGELVSTVSSSYPNGYAFQALSVVLMNLSGVGLAALQTVWAPLLAMWVVIPAWLAFREFTGTARAATLATAILFTQPEFLFVIMRGTHEKFTRGLMFLCFYLLLRSLREKNRPVQFAGFVIAFYLSIYGIISFNNMISTSFIAAILLAMLLTAVLSLAQKFRVEVSRVSLRRLIMVLTTSLVIAFLFTIYLYTPAQHDLMVMDTMVDRVAALFLDVEEAAATRTNPYTTWVVGSWISLPVYFLLTLANWIVLLASALIWLRQSIQWFLKRRWPEDDRAILLWAFYGGFAFLGAMTVIVDQTGMLSANLQHRYFPSFSMLGAPVVAKWLVDRTPRQTSAARAYYAVMGTLFMLLAVLSTLKATNEPLLTNKWLFYSPGEMQAVNWAEQRLTGRSFWTALDERLAMGAVIGRGGETVDLSFDYNVVKVFTKDLLMSDITRAQFNRIGVPPPIFTDDYRTYDNGRAQIFHRRPLTPYQK